MNIQVENENHYDLPPVGTQVIKFLRIFFISQIAILLLTALIGIMTSRFMNIGTSIALGISFLLLTSITIYLYLKYRKIPVVQEKAIFVKQKKEIEDEIKEIRDAISRCDKIRNQIAKEETKQLDENFILLMILAFNLQRRKLS